MASKQLFKKFFILMWKNLLGKKRRWVGAILEIIVPTALFMALVALRTEGGSALNPVQMPEQINTSVPLPVQICTANIQHSRGSRGSQLLYYPSNDITDQIMKKIETSMASTYLPLCENIAQYYLGNFTVTPVNSSDMIETITNGNEITEDTDKPVIYGGIIFDTDSENVLKYTMRLATEYTQTATEYIYSPFSFDGPQDMNGERYNLQTSLQAIVDLAYIEVVTDEKLLFSANLTGQSFTETIRLIREDLKSIKMVTGLEQMAYPAYLSNNLALILNFMLPMFIILSFAFIVPPVLKRIVFEKETGVKELMKMMGLRSWLHWICWFLNSIIPSAISILIMVCLVHITFKEETGPVLSYSNPVCTFIFLFLYASALITQLFAISTLFDRPNLALGLGILFHMLSYFIPSNLINQTSDGYAKTPFGTKILLSFFPNINIVWGVKYMMELEGKGLGVQWDTLSYRISPGDKMTMGVVWIMFLVDILFYSILIWYLDNVRPGKYGVAKPLYFPFLPGTWRSTSNTQVEAPETRGDSMEAKDKSMFEKEPTNLDPGIQIRGLRKEFTKLNSKPVIAVDEVSFSAYHGEITTLLGHNGAGKTTTMSVLTGLYSPTAGSAKINGYDISTNMDKVRESLGLCPQHNMLFEDLTVREHLVFFGMLKGLSKGKAEKESKEYISMLNLMPKKNVLVTNLSGGMKRKVNLGIALIGGSKVVMLDEPTSGMDPEARRGMWDLLLSIKADRTILLTTHFMEEADVLGDRIAIMARGKVSCYGTPFFLKNRFGSGYTLTVSKNTVADTTQILDLVQTAVPGSKLTGENEETLTISLPSESSRFPNMFESLEDKSTQLGVNHLGLGLTTMEDVFLKIGEMTEKAETDGQSNGTGYGTMNSNSPQNGHSHQEDLVKKRDLDTGFNLFGGQLKGLLTKRILYTYRRPILYIVMMLVPIVMAVLNVWSLNEVGGGGEQHPLLSMSLSSYNDPVTFIGSEEADWDDSTSFSYNFKKTIDFGSTVNTVNVSDAILEAVGERGNLAVYKDSYVIAGQFDRTKDFEIEFGGTSITVLPNWNGLMLTGVFNSVPLHAKPLAQQYLSNGILQYLERDQETKHKIEMSSHPLPESNKDSFEYIATGGSTFSTYGYGIVVPTGLSILVSAFLIFPLNERATSAKQVQIMSGLHPVLFWISNLIWDNLLYIISALIMYGLILGIDENETFSTHGAGGALVLIVLFLGIFGIPFSYVVSFFFTTAAAGFSVLIIVNILAGSIAPVAVFLLRQFGDGGNPNLLVASDVVRWVFNWFPIFPFSRALMAIATVQADNNLCINNVDRDKLIYACKTVKEKPELAYMAQQYIQCCQASLVGEEYALCGKPFDTGRRNETFECHQIESFYTWDKLKGINLDITMLAVDGILLIFILAVIEWKLIPRLFNLIMPARKDSDDGVIDEDVLIEQERVQRRMDNDILTVLDLHKYFSSFHAVRGLSFGVRPGECFGLLGINGAGKTTTFRMLTGDEIPTKGTATLLGRNLHTQRRQFLKNIGYCPQFDSIIPELTGRQLLTLMCRVRGVPQSDTKAEVERWTNFLGIQEYIDRESGSYSGGNKRKLNVAMSLVGEPPIVFLDEPSTGVDPVARRNLWNIIKGIQANGQAVVLTSHSMEECEALCDRLGIMVNGQFQCFGSVPHLKNKFAQGFTLNIKLNLQDADNSEKVEDEMIEKVQQKFSKAVVKDRHTGYLQFSIEDPHIPLHTLFRNMENLKSEGSSLEEYSIKETTLEQVFLSFARHQVTNV